MFRCFPLLWAPMLLAAGTLMAQPGGITPWQAPGSGPEPGRRAPSLWQAEDPVVRDREGLLQLADSLSAVFQEAQRQSVEKALQLGLEARFTTREGVRYALQRVEDGLPYYYYTLNAGGAVTSATRELYPGGANRLFLTGRGLSAGMWDAGSVYPAHPELSGKVENRDPLTGYDGHATHVAGTLVARGLREQARGMAYEGRILAYDWENDLGEMATEAARGMLLSNHSYGTPLGWDLQDGQWRWMGPTGADEDYRFGFYSSVSRAIDQIAYSAPYYLPVWAAGNDRDDAGDNSRPPDGPFDTIGPEALSKNVLTVGAVNGIPEGYARPEDVVMTPFSSWGPTDDGRIKPDLVTKGRSVLSTYLGDQYVSSSGTSMAAPIVAGSLLLIQELYHGMTGGSYLRAASLKGLAIHTARQAGAGPGPDYAFGWGLLDASRMAGFLTRLADGKGYFLEGSLVNNQVFEYSFTLAGEEPLTATLAWTDVPGTPVAAQLNPADRMLVNDLDMRVIHEGGEVYLPWVLDPDSPAAPAGRGDNFRDNAEKIFIESPPAGNYRLVINHKSNLIGGKQDFSLFVQEGDPGPRTSYYWVGSNGQWHDPSKWSLSSGGEPAGVVPGPDDHVVLDRHSFSQENQLLTLLADVACHTLTVTAGAQGLVNMNGRTLSLSGSLYAERGFFDPGGPGMLRFEGTRKDAYVYFEDPGKASSAPVSLVFDHPAGRWRLLSSLAADRLVLRAGEVVMEDVALQLRELLVEDNTLHKVLNMRSSRLYDLEQVYFPDRDFLLMAGKASFRFGEEEAEHPVEGAFNTGGVMIHSLVNHARLEVRGRLLLHELFNDGPLGLYDDLEADDLMFTGRAAFTLFGESGILVGDTFSGYGTPDRLVPFEGAGEENAIHSRTGRVFCLDYLSVHRLHAIGPALFNAGENSTVSQSYGWLQMDCGDILFADFEVTSPCRNSWTFFHDRSSGPVEQWLWQFDTLGGSEEQSPVFTFPDTGAYQVRLAVSAGDRLHETTRSLQVVENPLPRPEIFLSGNTLFVDVEAAFYQWFRDGHPIDGATGRTYHNEGGQTGVYQVLIGDEFCNRPSINEIPVSAGSPHPTEKSLLIYPNPAREQVRVSLGTPIHWLEVFDMLGRPLFRQEGDTGSVLLDVGGVPQGIYLLRVYDGQRLHHGRIRVY